MSSQPITAQEIKRIRGKYGLTQQAFARLLGIGDASIVRYENGITPTRSISNLIRAANMPEFMLDCLQRDGDLLTDAARSNAEKIIYSILSFDGKGDVMDMTEIYTITLQQEILNERAANIMADLHKKIATAEECDDALTAQILEFILNDLAHIKPEITTLESANTSTMEKLKGKIDALEHLATISYLKAA